MEHLVKKQLLFCESAYAFRETSVEWFGNTFSQLLGHIGNHSCFSQFFPGHNADSEQIGK